MDGIDLIEAFRPGGIRDFHLHWERMRGDKPLPARRDLDPVDIPRILPMMTIGAIEYDPFRVKYRLAGTWVVETTGFEITGKYVDEIAYGPVAATYHDLYRAACTNRTPTYACLQWQFDSQKKGWYELGAFPFSDDGKTVNTVVTVEDYSTLKYTWGLL